jgi:phosphohistidine phosphatase
MLVVLLRHAEAEEHSSTGLDGDRRLTAAGEKRARQVARALVRLVPSFDRIYVSPLQRARQTAEPVAEAAKHRGELVETPALRPGASPVEILRLLRDNPAGSVLLVGHQPHLGALFGHLLGRSEAIEVPMKKASAAAFDVAGDPLSGHAELQFYLTPKALDRLA